MSWFRPLQCDAFMLFFVTNDNKLNWFSDIWWKKQLWNNYLGYLWGHFLDRESVWSKLQSLKSNDLLIWKSCLFNGTDWWNFWDMSHKDEIVSCTKICDLWLWHHHYIKCVCVRWVGAAWRWDTEGTKLRLSALLTKKTLKKLKNTINKPINQSNL